MNNPEKLKTGVYAMQLTDFSLQTVFKRAGAASVLTGSLLLTGCATNIIAQPDSCISGNGFQFIFGFTRSGFDKECGEYQKEKLRMEADIKRAETLMRKPNDPVSNALGVLLSFDLNPEAKKKLDARMGGADKIRIEPETLVGLLAANNMQSRYVGMQLYAHADKDTQNKAGQLLKEQNIDIATLIPPAPGAAPLPRTTTTCIRTRKGNQVILDCPK